MTDRPPNGYCKHMKKLRGEECSDCAREIEEAKIAEAKAAVRRAQAKGQGGFIIEGSRYHQ